MLMMLSNLPVKIIIHICTYMKKKSIQTGCVLCSFSTHVLSSAARTKSSNQEVRFDSWNSNKSNICLG